MIAGDILHCIEALRFSCWVSYRAVLVGEWQLIWLRGLILPVDIPRSISTRMQGQVL